MINYTLTHLSDDQLLHDLNALTPPIILKTTTGQPPPHFAMWVVEFSKLAPTESIEDLLQLGATSNDHAGVDRAQMREPNAVSTCIINRFGPAQLRLPRRDICRPGRSESDESLAHYQARTSRRAQLHCE